MIYFIITRQANITLQPSDIEILHAIESLDGLRVTYYMYIQTQSGAVISSSSLYGTVIVSEYSTHTCI